MVVQARKGGRLGSMREAGARRFRVSLRVRLAVTVSLVAALALIVLAGTQAYSQLTQLRNRVADENLRPASLVGQEVEGQIRSTFQELTILSRDRDLIEDVL